MANEEYQYQCLYCSSVTLPVPTHLFLYVTQYLEFHLTLRTMLSGGAIIYDEVQT